MKALAVTLIMIGFFASNAQATDKELTTKIIQSAITAIIMDKQSSEVADGVIINIQKVSSSGSWTIRERQRKTQ